MNNIIKLRTILCFAFIVLILVLIPSNKPLQALKCDKYEEGDINESISLSYPNLNVSGIIDNGYCLQNCIVPPNFDGDMAVADPIERFQYQFDSTAGTWIDFPASGWELLIGASPTDCTEDAVFWVYYESYIYQFGANIDVSGLSDGTHMIYLKARYEIGREWTTGGLSFTIDTIPPTCNIVYTNGWELPSRAGSINVQLTENDSESGVQSGNVDVRTRAYGGSFGSWGNTGLPSGGSTINDFNYTGSHCTEYQFRYRVTDNAGNLSEGCNGAGGTWCDPGYITKIDTVAPTRGISYSTGTICQASFGVNISAGDDCSGVSTGKVEKRQRTLSGSYGGWSVVRYTTSNFTFGGSNGYCYQLRYQTTDNAGNTSSLATGGEVCIDTSISPNTPTLIAPPSSWINYDPNFKATITDPGGQNVRGHFHIETTGGSTVLDDGVGNWVSSGGTSCYLSNCSSGYSMSDGQYNWRAFGEDIDNCTGASTANRWLGVDKTDPTGDITHSPPSPDAGDTVLFSAGGLDATSGLASIDIYVDGGLKKSCPSSTICSYTGGPYSAGNHTYFAIFTDNATNTYTTSIKTLPIAALDLNVSLTANPEYGNPGFTTDLTATVGGSATGDIIYQFDCTNDGSFEHTNTTDQNPYSYNGCPAYDSDSTARVQVTREGLTADDTVNLYVSTLVITPDPAGVIQGGTIQFTATYDTDGSTGPNASQNVSGSANWSSSVPAVATINSSGLATGVAVGSTIITAIYSGLTDTADLDVGARVSSYRVIIAGINRAPVATNLQHTDPPDWCGVPTYFFSWTYSDPDSDIESRFDFQVDTDAGFTDPIEPVDRSYSGLSWPSPTQNSQSVYVSVGSLPDYLTYNQTYYWRVRVWDVNNSSSGWINGGSLNTQAHRWPLCDFSWLPSTPNPDEGVQFTDESTCYDDVGSGSPCSDSGGSIDSFSWTFEDANPATSNIQNPITTFTDQGNKQVSLTVVDSDGFSCTAIKTIKVNLPLPKWKEVGPQ